MVAGDRVCNGRAACGDDYCVQCLVLGQVEDDLNAIVNEHNRHVDLSHSMHYIARKRIFLLYELVQTDDPFERDQKIQELGDVATEFVVTRQKLLNMKITETERDLLEKQNSATRVTLPIQEKMLELVQANDLAAANHLLIKQMIPAQNRTMAILADLVTLNRDEIEKVQRESLTKYRQQRGFLVMAGVLAVLFALAIGWQVRRRMEGLIGGLQNTQGELAASLRTMNYQKVAMDEHAIVSIADPAGFITYANEKFCEVAQYSREELIGRNHNILNSRHHSRNFFKDLWQAIGSGRTWHGEVCNRRKDGGLYWVDTTIVPFLDVSGKPYQYVSIRTDITKLKQVQASQQRTSAMLQAIRNIQSEFIQETDEQTLFDHIVAEVVKLSGSQFAFIGEVHGQNGRPPRVQILGLTNIAWNAETQALYEKRKENLMYFDNPDSLFGAVLTTGEAVIANDPAHDPRRGGLPPGYPPLTAFLGIPLYTGERMVGMIGLANREGGYTEDILDELQPVTRTLGTLVDSYSTRVKRQMAEQALKQAHAELEQRVEERTLQLTEANSRLTEANAAKAQFLATMSHELRTPLNAIIGFSGVMLKGIDGPLNEAQRDSVQTVNQSGKHLLLLINEILDLSKIEAGKMELQYERFPVAPMLDEVTGMLSVLVKEKGLQLKVVLADDITEVEADRQRVKQILLNLLSNAVKFTDYGEVRIICRKVQQQGDLGGSCNVNDFEQDWLLFAVEDTGVGIPERARSHIFEEFRQVDNGSARSAGGTGLGLPIAKRLAELHGGRLWLAHTSAAGSSFSVILPLIRIPHEQPSVSQEKV